ncbi:MAG: hypothetical protein RLY78_4284 [Pseudomonadota bacterium]
MTSLTIRPVARAALVLVAGTVLALGAQAAGRTRASVQVAATTPPLVIGIPTTTVTGTAPAPVIVNPSVSCNAGGSTSVSRC